MERESVQPKSIKEMFEEMWDGCTITGFPKDFEKFCKVLKNHFPNSSRTSSVRDFCDNGEYRIMFNNEERGSPKRSLIFTSILVRLLGELKVQYPEIEISVY
jgi:hypothetical protein